MGPTKTIVKIGFLHNLTKKKKKKKPFELHMAWKSQGNVLDGFSGLVWLKVVF